MTSVLAPILDSTELPTDRPAHRVAGRPTQPGTRSGPPRGRGQPAKIHVGPIRWVGRTAEGVHHGSPPESCGEGEAMPLMLITLLPIEWTRHDGIAEAIAYSVYGLPSEKRTIIAMRPGGWRVVRNTLLEFDHGRVYPSAEEALAALKAWIEGGKTPPTAED